MNWHLVTSLTTLARELCKVAVRMKEVPKTTHYHNWWTDNAELVQSEWHAWRLEFPNALHDNLMRLSPRYRKKVQKS